MQLLFWKVALYKYSTKQYIQMINRQGELNDMKKKVIITLLTVSMICLSSCGKADDIEPVISEAVETPDQQEVEEETTVDEEPEQEVVEADTVEEDKEADTTSQTNGAGEQITPKEEDYFKEAEELWALHQEELDVNWESFRSAYAIERQENNLSKDAAYAVVYELFKLIEEEQPAETAAAASSSSSSSTASSSQQQIVDDDAPVAYEDLSEEAKAFWDSVGGYQTGDDIPIAELNEVTGFREGISAQ